MTSVQKLIPVVLATSLFALPLVSLAQSPTPPPNSAPDTSAIPAPGKAAPKKPLPVASTSLPTVKQNLSGGPAVPFQPSATASETTSAGASPMMSVWRVVGVMLLVVVAVGILGGIAVQIRKRKRTKHSA